MSDPGFDFRRLSIPERLQLVEDIWDSIAQEAPDAVPLTDAQKAELDRRDSDYAKHPESAIPWAQVREELHKRSK